MGTPLAERFAEARPLEQLELELMQALVERPGLLDAREEAVLRTALSLARTYKLHHQGHDYGVQVTLTPFRHEVTRRLGPVLKPGMVERALLLPHISPLAERTQQALATLTRRFEGRVSAEDIDHQLRHKELVLVLGGGGGTAYVYLGVMRLLEEFGIKPKLMVGTSMGAILSLFRSRLPSFDTDELASVVRTLSWKKLFRAVSMENRYGLPAALRLFLRSGIGRWFGVTQAASEAPRLKDLAIDTIVAVGGIRQLPHALSYYEQLTSASPTHLMSPRVWPKWLGAIGELVARPELLTTLHLGADEDSRQFDAIDAAGFSSALPGVIHYDVLRADPNAHELIHATLKKKHVFRLIDGGITDNLPAKAAWRALHSGRLGTRNGLVLALNGFATKLRQPAWLPLQTLAELNVKRNRPYAHLVHDFRRTLSPLAAAPTVAELFEAIELGRRSFAPMMPLIRRLMAPVPRLQGMT